MAQKKQKREKEHPHFLLPLSVSIATYQVWDGYINTCELYIAAMQTHYANTSEHMTATNLSGHLQATSKEFKHNSSSAMEGCNKVIDMKHIRGRVPALSRLKGNILDDTVGGQ